MIADALPWPLLSRSSHYARKWLDERVLRALRGWRAKGLEIRMQCRLGEESSHVGEGGSGAKADKAIKT